MATVAPPAGQAAAPQFRRRSRLKDFGRKVTYKIAGLPIAARAAIDRSEVGPDAVIRRAYARRFWRPRRGDELASLALALVIWPFALIGLEAVFLAKNGATVARRSNRPLFRQMIDQVRLYVCAGVLPPWYYIFELHDQPSTASARNFIYRWESKGGIFRQLNEGDRAPQSILSDKAAFACLCERSQVRTVPVLALASAGRIDQRAEDVEFCRDLFVKPNVGRGGKGAERWDYVGPGYRNPAGEEIDRDDLFARLAKRSLNQQIIVQPRIVNHAALEPLNNGALSTVRILTCLDESGQPEVVGAAMRMAIDGNHVVDNLHAGGIAAAVDIDAGTLGPASDLGADASFGWVERHPGTDAPILGMQLPMWEDVKHFAVRAHGAFADRVIVGWDIAIIPDGPILVEGNGAPDLDIMQRFIRHGLMADRLGALLAFHVSQLGLDRVPLT
jgi:hypothetical protein